MIDVFVEGNLDTYWKLNNKMRQLLDRRHQFGGADLHRGASSCAESQVPLGCLRPTHRRDRPVDTPLRHRSTGCLSGGVADPLSLATEEKRSCYQAPQCRQAQNSEWCRGCKCRTRGLTRPNLKTPRAAALAGIIFSILLVVVFSLLRMAVPADPQDSGAWLQTSSKTVAFALNLIPFSGIAFLWFIGVFAIASAILKIDFLPRFFLEAGCYFSPCCSLPPRWLEPSSLKFTSCCV